MKLNILAVLVLSLFTYAASAREEALDRKLTSTELQQLLPSYVAIVEASVGVVPSAEDNRALGITAYSITNPIYAAFRNGKIVGQQSHTIDALVKELEEAVQELKSRTNQERRAETDEILEGFKGRLTSKVSCHLGYSSQSKVKTERIVKCVDNRSEAGSGDDEGYADERTFILSIDAKTLAPISVLSIDHFIAG